MSHTRRPPKKLRYSGNLRIIDQSLNPNPTTTFPVHRDTDGNLQETSTVTPFPVDADLTSGEGLEALIQVVNALVLEQRLTNLHLSRLSGEEFTIDDLEEPAS